MTRFPAARVSVTVVHGLQSCDDIHECLGPQAGHIGTIYVLREYLPDRYISRRGEKQAMESNKNPAVPVPAAGERGKRT